MPRHTGNGPSQGLQGVDSNLNDTSEIRRFFLHAFATGLDLASS